MTRYADPQRCPDCLHAIEHGTATCPSCDLPLAGPLAGRLFQTLAYADELLGTLRTTDPVAVPASATSPATPAARSAAVAESTAPRPAPAKRGLSAASVPKILLGLGAGCLLVAALVFLAVTWSVMGVAGRTATLLGFTAIAGGLAAWVCTKNLRAAAEALSVVALGLLSFDLFGARDSGWFGDIGDPGFFVLLGAVVTTVAGAGALAVGRTPVRALTGAEIVGVLGTALTVVAFVDGEWLAPSATLTVAAVLTGALSFAAHRLRLRAGAVGTAVVAALIWATLATTAFERATSNPTARELWLELEAWPLLASAALVGGLALARPLPIALRVLGLAVAGLVLAAVALIPFSQGTTTEFTLAVLALLALACALTWFAPQPWAMGCAATAILGAGWMSLVAGALSSLAAGRLAEAGASLWRGTTGGMLPEAVLGGPEPWLLPLAALAVIATCVVLAHSASFVDRLLAPFADLAVGLSVATASVVATVASYPAPLWVVLAPMLLAGAVLTIWSLRRDEPIPLALGSAFMFVAVATSLYDEWLTALALLLTLVLAGAVHLRWTGTLVSAVAGGVLAASLAGSVWTWGALTDLEATWVALGALLAIGVLVIAVPVAGARAWSRYRDVPATAEAGHLSAQQRFAGVEVATLVCAFVVSTAGVAAAAYALQPTWTALYLTLAGVVATLISLLRADRRLVGWLGGALLATASWVRLWDVGVQAPEAYTLPSAVALALTGLVHLRRRPASSTMAALAPSLGLALVPSLLWVMWEPVGLRSILLGMSCLALLVLGARLRWTAPVVFAAAVGTLVVLRHVAPVADAVPQWVLFGSAGAFLVAMGITWERRIQETRAVVGYVRALR